MHHWQADESTSPALLHIADKRVVIVGGGTGPFALLSRLKDHPCSITAIVTMADSGGSSRRLMDEFGQLPFGDLRQALVALSRKGALWRDIFTYRFQGGQQLCADDHEIANAGTAAGAGEALRVPPTVRAGVSGHCLGNLIISALESLNEGKLLWALEDAQELLGTAGSVIPVTLAHAMLCAELVSGEIICSESEIDRRGENNPEALPPIERLFLRDDAHACDEALRAIRRADVIILGPGDLYTSILPNLLVRGIAEAICASAAQKIYICNLMTKHGETDDFAASDFVAQVQRYLGGPVNRVILHNGSFPAHLLAHYAARSQYPVEPDVEAMRELTDEVIVDDFLAIHGPQFVRHNPDRLIAAIFVPTAGALTTPLPTESHADGFAPRALPTSGYWQDSGA